MSLIELLLVLVIAGMLATLALPRFAVAAEGAKVDACAATLRSVWIAQRMHWIETGAFAPDLASLAAAELLEPAVASASTPFAYAIDEAEGDAFTASAVRAGSARWSGTITLDELGVLSGSVSDGEGHDVAP